MTSTLDGFECVPPQTCILGIFHINTSLHFGFISSLVLLLENTLTWPLMLDEMSA